MLTSFDIIKNGNINEEIVGVRFDNYKRYRAMYEGNFSTAFPETIRKIRSKYPLDYTTAQSLIEINLFVALTDFFKSLLTNNGLIINVGDNLREKWEDLAQRVNFITVVKEVFIDNSRFGNGLFKVALVNDQVNIFSVCPDCWIPVFKNGNLNELDGHILIHSLSTELNNKQCELRHIEKQHKGYVENEVWIYENEKYSRMLSGEEMSELGIEPLDDFSDMWNDFIVFPVKNTTESDKYFGESDYKQISSIIEDIMLTVSQNSKIINRHANPKLAGSEQNLEHDPVTNQRTFPDTDFVKVGTDGVKPEYINVDLQAPAINQHIETLMQFFYIISKTPPQAYGVGLSGNMSGESLKKIFMSSLAKADDIKQVSFTSAIEKVVTCAMAFNKNPIENADVDWGDPIPQDKAEMAKDNMERVDSGTLSKVTAIQRMDNVSEEEAQAEVMKICAEQKKSVVQDIADMYPDNE